MNRKLFLTLFLFLAFFGESFAQTTPFGLWKSLHGKKVIQVSTGSSHVCAILYDSSVKCWGEGGNGQLGYGNTNDLGDAAGEMMDLLPAVDLGTNKKAIKIVTGFSHTCVLLDDSSVKCWGEGGNGQLGYGNTNKLGDGAGEMGNSLPAVDLGTNKKVIDITVGWAHSCALLDDYSIKCWGLDLYGQLEGEGPSNLGDGAGEMGNALPVVDLGTNKKALKVVAGANHTCAILDDSSVKCWGEGSSGQLGYGNTSNTGDLENQMGNNLLDVDLGTNRKAVQIALGMAHTCALLDDSSVKCWGMGGSGVLGYGNINNKGDEAGEMGDSLPAVDLGTNKLALQITAGFVHTCALLDDYSVKCWGNGALGALGYGDTTTRGDGANEMGSNLPAIDLGTNIKVVHIKAGMSFTCALLEDSSIKCFGGGDSGRLGSGNTNNLGDGASEMGDNLLPVNLGRVTDRLKKVVGHKSPTTRNSIFSLVSGDTHNCVLLGDSSVKCWGGSFWGQLGNEDNLSRGYQAGEMGDNLPVVNLGANKKAIQIAAGAFHTCAILENSWVKCWGYGFYGQCGSNDTDTRGNGVGEMGDNLPFVNLGTNKKAAQLAMGAYHTCVLLDDSTVKCFGSGGFGRLGYESTASLGNGAGEMGDALPTVNVGTNKKVVQLVAGGYHNCVLLDDSSVKCWGNGGSGRLGYGSILSKGDGAGEMGDSLAAVDLGTNRKAVQITAGNTHTCALLDDSSVKCWGDGAYGMLGSGNTNDLGNEAGEMGDSLPVVDLGTNKKAIQIAAANAHTCALLDDFTVKCWGYGLYGRLGIGDGNSRGDGANEMGDNLPIVNLGTNRKAVQIEVGFSHTCALLDDSSVKCWGYGVGGRLGQGSVLNLGDSASEMGDNLKPIFFGTN